MKNSHQEGTFELITGPMFSGKTTALINKYNQLELVNSRVLVCKPQLDNRYSEENIVSHNGESLVAHSVVVSSELEEFSNDGQIILIDEAQFFDDELPDVIKSLVKSGVTVIAAGLEYDYMRNDFGPMSALKDICNSFTRLTATCDACGAVGTHTYRKNREVVDTVLLGSDDSYEVRCESCYNLD